MALSTVIVQPAITTIHRQNCFIISKWNSTSVQFSRSVKSNSSQPHPSISACQASLSITNCWSLPKTMSIESVIPSNHLILYHPLLCPQSFPASGSFQMSHLFPSSGQSIWVSVSTSVLPMNTVLGFLIFTFSSIT